MINLGRHEITVRKSDADGNVTFSIDTNRAKICKITRDELDSIMALDDVNNSIYALKWLARFDAINVTQHEAVMAHLKHWQSQLTEDVDKIKSKLGLD